MSRRRVISAARLWPVLAGLLVAAPFARAQTDGESFSAQVQALFERAREAVVRIEATDQHGQLVGTGFFIDPAGTLYTSYTIGGESRDIVVSHGTMKYPATRLVADPRSGVAILKVEAETPFLRLGKSSALGVGAMVMTIGYPMDLPAAPSVGCVGGFDIGYRGRFFSAAHIRATVPVQRGEGGAPLLSMNGDVVGVVISSLDHGPGCYALPVEAAEKVRADYMHYGEVRPGWLGIKVGETSPDLSGSAAAVEGFVAGAPANRSNLRSGDILVEIGGRKISSPEDVLDASFYITAGTEVPITVSRDGELVEMEVHAGEHPSSPRKTALKPPVNGPGLLQPAR